MLKSQIPTPALVIDCDAMEKNIECMSEFLKGKPVHLRPHFKTHKSPHLAKLQMEAGAIGLTCAKLGEAEVLVAAGIPSVLIANEVVDPVKIARMAELARDTQLIVAADHPELLHRYSAAARAAGSTIHVLVEINVGLNRCGVEDGETAWALAERAARLPGLHFAGVMGYEGHTVLVHDLAVREPGTRQAMGKLTSIANEIRARGLPVEIVSGGGTGTYAISGVYPGITELQCGSYILMDTEYRYLNLPFQNALTLQATVISIPSPQRAIIDVGMKGITLDNGLPDVLSPAGVQLKALHEEHGILEVDPAVANLKIGDLVELIPSHVCTTVNLHDNYYACRGDQVEAIWPISGRGKFQ